MWPKGKSIAKKTKKNNTSVPYKGEIRDNQIARLLHYKDHPISNLGLIPKIDYWKVFPKNKFEEYMAKLEEQIKSYNSLVDAKIEGKKLREEIDELHDKYARDN